MDVLFRVKNKRDLRKTYMTKTDLMNDLKESFIEIESNVHFGFILLPVNEIAEIVVEMNT